MSKRVHFGLALAAAMLAPGSAAAIDSRQTFDVSVLSARDRDQYAGAWHFELDADGHETCDYAVEWESPSGSISTDCVFQESKVHGRKSCRRNSAKNFPTIIKLHPDDTECQGFMGSFGLLEDVTFLVLGETWDHLSGVIMFDGPIGGVYGIVAGEREPVEPPG